jgi:ketosteroid isomerase-like protein
MSAEENVEMARRLYEALNRGDLDAFTAGISPDVEFRSLVAEAEGNVYRGHEGVREWWRDVAEALGGLEFDAQEIRAVGSDGILARIRVKGEASGLPVEQTMWQVIRFRDRLAIRWDFFRTEEEARAALG